MSLDGLFKSVFIVMDVYVVFSAMRVNCRDVFVVVMEFGFDVDGKELLLIVVFGFFMCL